MLGEVYLPLILISRSYYIFKNLFYPYVKITYSRYRSLMISLSWKDDTPQAYPDAEGR